MKHLPILRHLRARPRLASSMFAGLAVFIVLPQVFGAHLATRLLLAWNSGIGCYLLLAAIMIRRAGHHHVIRRRALAQYEGRHAVLTGVTLAVVSCMGAIFAELGVVKEMQGTLKFLHIGLAVITVALSWVFIHLMFALHYAHEYYLEREGTLARGIDFPGTPDPDYLDFLYFSCIIGTSGQTADVALTSQPMRRLALVHSVLSYAYNTTILALTINIASGLL